MLPLSCFICSPKFTFLSNLKERKMRTILFTTKFEIKTVSCVWLQSYAASGMEVDTII